MSEDKVYKDGDIVWVKLGNNWWPAEVTGPTRHPEGLIKHLKRVPYCVVKFFNENTYEYVRSSKQIFPFQCQKQEEFIRKGYSLYNSGNTFMEKFPPDVEVAKQLTRRKETSLVINDRPDSIVKAILGQQLIRTCDEYYDGSECSEKRRSGDSVTKILNITPKCNNDTLSCEKPRTEKSTNTLSVPNDKTKHVTNAAANNSSNYQCNFCDFSSVRLNVMILHRKMHSNRNSTGSNSSILSKPTSVKSMPVEAVPTTATTTKNNTERNQIKQIQNSNKDKNNSKTKVSTTITTTAARPARGSSAVDEPTSQVAPVDQTNTAISAAEATVIPLKPKEKNNRISKVQTLTSKSKIVKKTTVKEKKVESAYDSILSDFCSVEMESSGPSEEIQSRRSLRHCKHPTEITAEKVPTICIDLSETKTIQKIPKKREYTTLQLQTEIPMTTLVPVVAEPDVVFLGDKEAESTTINSKKDAEDIRRMLLADWSDDDETPNDAIVVDDNIVLENTESNMCRSAPVSELHMASTEVITSTPIITKPSSASTGRIRNIPKKDRRDVVLQDFNSDLSLVHGDNLEHAAKNVAVDLDSSNSSVVEIIEDQPPAAIITINDDEDQENSKSQKQQTEPIGTENKDNDKSASAATSTTTLSCFDFQDDEEEQDNTNTTIPHFKKKYLSGDKLQTLSLTTTDELREDDAAESRAELAEKDQRLAAEIESLLEQTQPTIADLLNANSFEESMSVKDLPIKERGKRIFKSRNKTRMEDNKNNTELAVITTVHSGLTGDYISNANSAENLVNDKAIVNNTELEVSTDREHDIVHIEGNVENEISLIEISRQESSCIPHTEISQMSEDKDIKPNENKENGNLSERNNDFAESICENNTSDDQKEQMEKTKVITSDNADENIDNEKSIETISKGKQSVEHNDGAFKQQLNDQQILVYQEQDCIEANSEQDSIVNTDQMQEEAEGVPPNLENIINKNINVDEEDFRVEDNNMEAVLHTGKKSADSLAENTLEDLEKADTTANKVKVLGIQIFKPIQDNFENDLPKESSNETDVLKSPEAMSSRSADKELAMFAPEIGDDNDAKELETIPPHESCKKETQIQCSENNFKIRVKSPEQLLDQAFVIASQQEQELPSIIESNVDARIATGTPTDENSSMGASDTGAEFGSPTSMLSEERLPAFRFQSNQTPQHEIETAETESNNGNATETHEEKTYHRADVTSSPSRKNLMKFKELMIKDCFPKSPQQRRYSMGFNYLQTEQTCFKRQRLSVDCITSNEENSFEVLQEKLLTTSENKIQEKVPSKRRHMKITPRRNVSELFKQHSSFKNHGVKNRSLENVAESLYSDDLGTAAGNEQLNNTVAIKENYRRLSSEVLEERAEPSQEDEPNKITTLVKTVISDIIQNEELENPNAIINSEENVVNDKLPTDTTAIENEEDLNLVEDEVTKSNSISKLSTTNEGILPEIPNNSKENQTDGSISKSTEDNSLTDGINESVAVEHNPVSKSTNIESTDESIANMLDRIENIDTDPTEIPICTVNRADEIENDAPNITLSFDDCKMYKNQVLETPFSPGVPPPTPQEREVVIETEIPNQPINAQQETEINIEAKSDKTASPLTLNEQENLKEITNEVLIPKEKHDCPPEANNPPATSKEDDLFREETVCTVTPLEKEPIIVSNDRPIKTTNEKSITDSELLAEPAAAHEAADMIIELEKKTDTSSTPKENNITDDCENGIQIPYTPQGKDLIIECEPSTPQDIIECDHNLPTQITPEKEVIIESDISIAASTQDKDIIIEENLQLDEKETLLAREFQVIQPKENSTSVDIPQESQPNNLQTDADKAAEEFLIEFDNIVNHSHTVDEDMQSGTLEDAINAEDLINNIIEEVHEDHQVKPDEPAKSESILPYEPLTTYKVVAHKNSWNQIFKDSFNKQLPAAKRRQTICFEISDTKEGVACKKQAFDFESILPVNKTIKRTAERKLTLPAIETKLSSSSQPHNIFALNHTQLTLNKKLIPTAKRKLSIEDNITSFIIERPKQQQTNAASGPPPLQRIRSLSRQAHIISRASIDSLSEPPPLQSNDNLFQEIFPSESTYPIQSTDVAQKPEGGIVISQQIISSPTITSTHQNKTTDAKISMNKQIGVDSRGNKYVIIKTPPTDIIVQPTLTSSTSAAVAATNNFGTTVTIQPFARTTTDVSVASATTKSTTLSTSAATTSRKQQLQQISITVPAKSALEVSNSSEMSSKTQPRNRRKSTQAKAVAAASVTSSNINSAKHRQAMEALSRRLSIASEAPSLAKMSRTSSTHVQTNNNNLTTFFGDTQISNIAQQQLIQLQQQQQHTQTSSPLPPPIILNKNAHQQSVMQRKTRKIPQQKQAQHQQIISATKTPHLQQQQQKQVQQQHNQQQSQQMQQQQFIAQISQQQQSQLHNSLQPPPLQQIQPQPLPMQQQIVQQSDGIIITTAATEDDNVIDSNTQLIALPTQPYPGYSETFLLCKVKGNTCKPVDNVPLYLNHQLNELVPVPLEAIEGGQKQLEHRIGIKASNTNQQQLLESQSNEPRDSEGNLQISNINCNLVESEMSAVIESDHQLHQQSQQQQIMEECVVDENTANANSNQINDFASNQEVNTELVSNNGILLNIEGQQVLLDAATFAHLLANPDANTQLISDDGTEYVLTHEVLAALQMQQQQQQALELVNAAAEQQQQQLEQASGTDIIAVALAGSDLYDSDVLTIDTSQGMQLIGGDGSIVFPAQTGAITQQHLTPPAVVTNAVLDQSPIMSTLEVPSSIATSHKLQGTQLITVPSHHLATSSNAALGIGGRPNLEDSLAAIGVTTQTSNIPSSLGLPITVTNPNIASKVTSAGPLNEMLQFVSHRPATAAATAAAVAAAALAGESRIFTD